jgi:hypothetical protein
LRPDPFFSFSQRCLWAAGEGVLFRGPGFRQNRNPHNLMDNFNDEVPGYKHNKEIARILENLGLKEGRGYMSKNLLCCYKALVRSGFLPNKEVDLVKAWLALIEKHRLNRRKV